MAEFKLLILCLDEYFNNVKKLKCIVFELFVIKFSSFFK